MARNLSALKPVDPILTRAVAGTIPDEGLFIAGKAIEAVPVDGKTHKGKIFVEPRRPFMGQEFVQMQRAPGANYPVAHTGSPTTVDYETVHWALRSDVIPEEHISRSQLPYQLETREALMLKRAILVGRERDLAAKIFDAAKFNASNTVSLVALPGGSGVKFGAAGSTEIKDLVLAMESAAESAGGRQPNKLIIGRTAANKLRTANDFRAYMGDQKNRTALNDAALKTALADALGLDAANVHIGKARYETANPGQTSSEADIWTDNILFYYDRPNAAAVGSDIRVSACTALRVIEQVPGVGAEMAVRRWLSDDPPGVYVACGEYRHIVPVGVDGSGLIDTGLLLTDCV